MTRLTAEFRRELPRLGALHRLRFPGLMEAIPASARLFVTGASLALRRRARMRPLRIDCTRLSHLILGPTPGIINISLMTNAAEKRDPSLIVAEKSRVGNRERPAGWRIVCARFIPTTG